MVDWTARAPQAVVSNLSSVDVLTSCVIDASANAVWEIVRAWGSACWLRGEGSLSFGAFLLGGRAATEVGSVRLLRVSNAQMFEQLTAVDDEERLLRWKLISHPQTVSPFSHASFINYVSSLKFKPVTVGDTTFVEWKARFFTEPHNVQQMHATLEHWCHVGFRNLQAHMLAQAKLQQLSQPAKSVLPQVQPIFQAPLSREAFAKHQELREAQEAAPMMHNHPLSSLKSARSDQQKRRFVGSLAEIGGVPYVQDNYMQQGSDIGSREGFGQAAQFHAWDSADAAAQYQHTMQPTLNSQHSSQRPNSIQNHTPPQGPGPPLSSSKSSRMACSTALASGSQCSTDTSSHQNAESRNSSWGSEAKEREVSGLPSKQSALRSQISGALRSQVSGVSMGNGSMGMDGCQEISSDGSRDTSWNSNNAVKTQDGHGHGHLTSNDLAAFNHQTSERLKALAQVSRRSSLAAEPSMRQPSQVDNQILDELAQTMEANRIKAEEPRTSFEEAAAQLEARHRQLHKGSQNGAAQQLQNPFAASAFASPFASPFTAAVPSSSIEPSSSSSDGADSLVSGNPFGHSRRHKGSAVRSSGLS